MTRHGTRTETIVCVACALLVLPAGCFKTIGSIRSAPATTATTAQPRPVIDDDGVGAVDHMIINGETIAAEDILIAEREDLQKRVQTMPADAYRRHVTERALHLVRRKIGEVLLHQVASAGLTKQELDYLGKLVDSEVRRIITTDWGGVERRFAKHLEARGGSIDEVRSAIQRELVIRSHIELRLKPRIGEPTRDEMVALFERHAGEFAQPPRRIMSLIDVQARTPQGVTEPTTGQLASAQAEARKRIEAADSAIRGGTSFADVARTHSDGFNAEEGGAWGEVTLEGVTDRFRPAVEVLQSLGTGEVSPIIEADGRFFLVRCDRFDPGAEPDFESLQPQLKQRYFRQEYLRMESTLIQGLQENAHVLPTDLRRFLEAVVTTAPHA